MHAVLFISIFYSISIFYLYLSIYNDPFFFLIFYYNFQPSVYKAIQLMNPYEMEDLQKQFLFILLFLCLLTSQNEEG